MQSNQPSEIEFTEELNLSYTQMTNQVIESFSDILKKIIFQNIAIQSLPTFPRDLEIIDFTNVIIANDLPEFNENLQSLSLINCHNINRLPKFFDGLLELKIKNCSAINELPHPLPKNLEHLELSELKTLKKIPNPLPINLKNLILVNSEILAELPSLPVNIRTINLSGCSSLTKIPSLPNLIKYLDLSNCISLKELPLLPDTIEYLDLSNCNSLKYLPKLPRNLKFLKLPDHIEHLDLSNCIDYLNLPDPLPKNLKTLITQKCLIPSESTNLPDGIENFRINNCDSLIEFPYQLPHSLKNLDLRHCTNLRNLPDLPPSLNLLNLKGCTSLNYSDENIKKLLDLENANQQNPNFRLIWPDHFDRNLEVKTIIDNIKNGYCQYYQNDDFWKNIEPQPTSAFATLSLVNRYLKEKLYERGGILKIIKPATIFSQRILQNPQLLETTDQHSKIYLDACINQPVAGFTEIANLANIDSCSTIPQKLERCKILIALDLIKMNIKKLRSNRGEIIGNAFEVELANAMLIEAHNKLSIEEKITEKWQAIPISIAYPNAVKDFITPENILTISSIINDQALKLNLTKVAEFMSEGHFCDFWLTQTLTKEQRDEIMQPYKIMVDRLSDNSENISNPDVITSSLEEQIQEMRKLEISCQEEMFKISKQKTLENIPKSSVSTHDSSLQRLSSSIVRNYCTIS